MATTESGTEQGRPGSVIPKKWSAADIGDLTGVTAVVTGGNGGLGLETARELARAGATVVIACRDAARGERAVDVLREDVPHAKLDVRALDLADLASVREFAAGFAGAYRALDLLVNNAGVMATPRGKTADGFELQIGTNHFGHFALTGLLLPHLLAAPAPRVVTVSSTLHAQGKINFDDLHRERRYNRYTAYGQAKLANLHFGFELDRRAKASGVALTSVLAHPGYAATNLQTASIKAAPIRAIAGGMNKLMAVSPRKGALPQLCAATLPGLPGGTFVGPSRMGQYRGAPGVVKAKKKAYDTEVAHRLWEVSEQSTGVVFDLATPRAEQS
ncbi:oxidoreductase [Yinghuangia seranimata]|uniref:oxidoreductase n=1 Tax=Yinghuangia seranimata TaxID=408067 RepID=UPI00248BB210|nr:oxidoreductase [Yinghuangia seranimata]MDI2127667.1 oxidoreductase [Yinghuangia seranimata]